jgi:hypothetical protein
VTALIIGASKPHHPDDALATLTLRLDADELKALAEPYQPHPILRDSSWMRHNIVHEEMDGLGLFGGCCLLRVPDGGAKRTAWLYADGFQREHD